MYIKMGIGRTGQRVGQDTVKYGNMDKKIKLLF
jgi:hypothetical protein